MNNITMSSTALPMTDLQIDMLASVLAQKLRGLIGSALTDSTGTSVSQETTKPSKSKRTNNFPGKPKERNAFLLYKTELKDEIAQRYREHCEQMGSAKLTESQFSQDLYHKIGGEKLKEVTENKSAKTGKVTEKRVYEKDASATVHPLKSRLDEIIASHKAAIKQKLEEYKLTEEGARWFADHQAKALKKKAKSELTGTGTQAAPQTSLQSGANSQQFATPF